MHILKLILVFTLMSFLVNCSSSKKIIEVVPVVVKDTDYIIKNTSSDRVLDMESMLNEIKDSDVIIIGESHNDPVAHHIEIEVVKGIARLLDNKIAVSMEMFERDEQLVLNEYLAGQIQESFLLKDARSWSNYKSDYRPMVEFAKEKGISVIAANAPRRYVRIVSTGGMEKLEALNDESKLFLPPFPIDDSNGPEYKEKFLTTMREAKMPARADAPKDSVKAAQEREERFLRIYNAQVVWDASMAFSIHDYKQKNGDKTVIHMNGSFHSDEFLGVYSQLKRFNPGLKVVTISVKPFDTFPEYQIDDIRKLANYVVIADEKLPRSY